MLHYGEYILASNAFQKYPASQEPSTHAHAQMNALFLKPANAMHNVGLTEPCRALLFRAGLFLCSLLTLWGPSLSPSSFLMSQPS